MSELILPIALWNGPPPHSVTSILLLLDHESQVLVTGSSSGQLCIWSIETEKPNKEGGLSPLIFCLGHNAPITAIIDCNYEERDAFVSISADGVTHVWSAQDGKCLRGTQFTTFQPLVLTCIPGERRLIALAGCHSEIEIIDAWTLKSTSTLRGHHDWITCLGTALCNGEPVLISGSRDGLVHFWSLKPAEDFPLRTVCIDDSPSPDINPLVAVVSPDTRSFIVVTQREWMLYTAQNSHFVCSVKCPEGLEWLGAKYLDSSTVLAWTSNALAAAYKLSIPASAEPLALIPAATSGSNTSEMTRTLSAEMITESAPLKTHAGVHPDSIFIPIVSGKEHENSSKPRIPAILYTINEFPLDPTQPPNTSTPVPVPNVLQQTPESDPNSPRIEQTDQNDNNNNPLAPAFSFFESSSTRRYESSFSQFAACNNNFFAMGDTTGHVGMWVVRSESFSPWCAGRVSDGWKGVESPSKAVTTSIVLEDVLLLIRGHENGQISTCTLPTDPFPKYNKAHAARVNCLLCSPVIGSSAPPASSSGQSSPITQKRFLVSGSDDFTIKVWELSTFELLHTFTHHTGPITSLFPPPPRNQSPEVVWDNTFFAVSEDKCVGLYTMDSMRCMHLFGVHPSLVTSLKAKREQDYLLVECVDGSVAVWEKGTGDLEGIVYGQVAREISENSETIWSSFSHVHGTSSAHTTAITEASPNGNSTGGNASSSGVGVRVTFIPNLLHRTPIQILYLDIKQIIRELYRTLAHSAAAISTSAAATSSSQLYKKPPLSVPRGRQSLQLSGGGSSGGASNASGNSISSPAYQVFSYLIPWGVDKAMDALCKKEMMLRPPVPDFAFGMKGDGGNISILVPSASGVGRWQCSPELTALITLSAVSLAKALLNLGDGKNSCIQILSYYCALLPETLGPRSSYVDPSLPLLASYWLDPLEDIMSASRSILVSTIDRLSTEARKDLTQSVAMQLRQTAEGSARGLLVVVLGIIGAERPEALDEMASRSASLELLKILYKGGTGPFTQAAVELLGKGFASWRPHVKDAARLIRGLFIISLQGDALGQTAHNALMLIGAQDPKQFIVCIGSEIHKDTAHSHTHASLKKDPCALLGQLPRLVETVVKSLDPHTPALRDACLKATTAVLHVMVKKYPMVSFHQESQRLAVGTSENVIIIYDLKTATRWHVLEGHKNSVSAVAFNDNGKALSSYSITETSVRIWQTGTSFFGILGSQPQCVKNFAVSKPSKPIPPQVQLETVRLQWASPSTLTLFRGWEQGTTFNVDPVT